MTTLEDLLEQNRVLRERVEVLERAAPSLADPMIRAAFEHSPAFLTVITPEGRFLATGRTSEAFGSVVGRTVFEFTAPEQHASMRDAYARVRETRQAVIYESVGYGENGEPNHTYLVRAVPMLDDGALKAIVLVPTDITERVRLERSLAESEEKLRFAIDATRIGLWSWDVERNEISWDRRVLDIFGVNEPPTDYDRYMALIHPDDRALVRRVVEEAIHTGVYTPFEHRLAPRGDGVERWVLGTGTVLPRAAGAPTLMGGALDITDQKRATAQLHRAQRVEALGQLTAGLTHNFNNLLGAIIPNLELALGHASREQTPLLTAALEASVQARSLIKKLMSLPARPPTTSPTSSDPRQVVERALALGRATFPREIDLRHAFGADVGHVGMDDSDLDQVVLNLLFNARDALERATGRARLIEISVDTVGAGGKRHVRLRVRDNGGGMSPAVRARVFEPFFTTKPAHRGSGLGLADALVRVRGAGGTLECESIEGQGTTFVLLLPETPAPGPRPPAAATPPAGSRGETILIVDDEPAVSAAVARLLRRQGYAVLEAGGAAQARAVLEAQGGTVKLVLLDQSMPNESGPEALPSLKRLTDAPIVLFTGGVAELPPGAAAILEKPAQSDELLRLVHDLVRRGT
jgi:PAS domain S-box-containing protein